MHLERLLDGLAVSARAFSTCQVARGWRLRLPSLDWVTLHFVLEGTGSVRPARGDGQPISPGSLAVVPAGLVHMLECGELPLAEATVAGPEPPGDALAVHTAGPSDAVELTVVCGRVQVAYGPGVGLFDGLREILVLDFGGDRRIRGIFESLLAEHESPGVATRLMLSALMSECLIHVFRRINAGPRQGARWLQALEDPDLVGVLDEILTHPERPHSVESLAALAGQSRSAFAERFRDCFGQTPMAFVREVRLRRAAELLRRQPPPSVGAVARRVGLSRSHFWRSFKDRFDATPSAFRGASRRRGAEEE